MSETLSLTGSESIKALFYNSFGARLSLPITSVLYFSEK